MGMFTVRVRVANPSAPDRFFDHDFWVDTGALYSFMRELGATALETFGVDADPVSKQLKRVAAVIGGFRATR